MIKRYWSVVVYVAAALGFALLMSLLLREEISRGGRTQMNISVVLYGEDERWTSLEQGIRQACTLLEIQTPLVNYSGEDAETQIQAIQREVEAGAQGLIVAAGDSEAMQGYLETLNLSIPLVLVETGAGSELTVVAPDNAAMGLALAGCVRDEGEVLVLYKNNGRESVRQRYEALMQELTEQGTRFSIWNGSWSPYALAAELEARSPVALVALDTETLEIAITAQDTARAESIGIYGVGASDKIVHALDRGVVNEICFPNEFNVGYLGIMRLAAAMGLDVSETHGSVDFVLARQDNLYDPDIERLLYPIIQ